MKRIALILSLIFFLCSCTSDNSEKRLFCKALGFDADDGKIIVTALFSHAGKDSPENEEKSLVTMAYDNPKQAGDALTADFENVLYKPLEIMVFGESVDEKTKRDILSQLVNHSEFQLKCTVSEKADAKAYIAENGEKQKDGMMFSQYYRKNFAKGDSDE